MTSSTQEHGRPGGSTRFPTVCDDLRSRLDGYREFAENLKSHVDRMVDTFHEAAHVGVEHFPGTERSRSLAAFLVESGAAGLAAALVALAEAADPAGTLSAWADIARQPVQPAAIEEVRS